MNCFQLIKTVLDELLEEIEGTNNDEKYEKIREKLNYLSNKYRNLRSATEPIDYEQPEVRFAYIYRYVTAHANLIYRLIGNHQELSDLFNKDWLNVLSAGGGPGSDLLGVLKYAMECDTPCSIACDLFDRERAWRDSWSDVAKKLGRNANVHVNFDPIDVTDPETWRGYRKSIRQADLITLTYFVSELYHTFDETEAFFLHLFENAKLGAYFLFVDNNTPDFYNWFDNLAQSQGNSLIASDEDWYKMPFDEQKVDLGEHYDRLEDPKITANIAFRLYQKPES